MSIVIVGAGPNLGGPVARRFGREGMTVGLIARDTAKLETLGDELFTDDLRVGHRQRTSATRKGSRPPSRPSRASSAPSRCSSTRRCRRAKFMKPILETTVDDVRGPLEFSVLGAVAAATAVIGPMLLDRRSRRS